MHHLLHRCGFTALNSFSIKNTAISPPHRLKKGRRNEFQTFAAEKESEFQVDPDKAREALRKLDEQLQSLSNKPINTPKIRAADVKWSPVQQTQEEKEESSTLSESFLASVGTGLLLFTILYNIFFLTVIKPSVDSPYTQQESPNVDIPVSP